MKGVRISSTILQNSNRRIDFYWFFLKIIKFIAFLLEKNVS